MIKPVRTAAPDVAKPLLTKEECKQFLRIDHADDDTLIEALRDAATAYLDGYTGILGRALINQTWRVNYASWPCDEIRLPLSPVSAVTSVKYYDSLNVQQTVTSSNYTLREDECSPYLDFISTYATPTLYDREDAIEVLFVAGYGADNTTVPAAIRAAALLMIGNLYEHREDVVIGETAIPMPMGSQSLLAPFRRRGV